MTEIRMLMKVDGMDIRTLPHLVNFIGGDLFQFSGFFQKLAKKSVLGPPGGPEKLATRVLMMETRISQISAPNSPGNGVS